MTKEQYDLLKAKKPEELTAEEKAAMLEYDAQLAAGRENGNEHMIPKSRLDDEIQKRKDLEARLAAIEKATKEAEEKRLIEANNFKGLAEKYQVELEALKPKAAIAEESEKVLKAFLESEIASIPEAHRSLIPTEMTTQQQLGWLAKNKSLLIKPAPFDIGAGRQGGLNNAAPVDLSEDEIKTAQQFGVKPEEYQKYKKGV